jgi:DtxR family transcriptional regulator, Mn-dependent transcriptional regulator
MANPGEHHPAFEEYCECIFELHEDNLDVIQARVADRLSVSRPSVSEMIKRMEAEGLIRLRGTKIVLTDDGNVLATKVVRRHRIAERFLTDILGLSWATAHHEAGKWEHVLSAEVEEAMNRVLNNPTTCPHGNSIPGSAHREVHMTSLADIQIGLPYTVGRITEELEHKSGVLEFLESVNLVVGTTATVTARSEDGNITLRINDDEVTIDSFIGNRVLVNA